MLSVTYKPFSAQCRCAEWHYAECRGGIIKASNTKKFYKIDPLSHHGQKLYSFNDCNLQLQLNKLLQPQHEYFLQAAVLAYFPIAVNYSGKNVIFAKNFFVIDIPSTLFKANLGYNSHIELRAYKKRATPCEAPLVQAPACKYQTRNPNRVTSLCKLALANIGLSIQIKIVY